ncbi:MAG: mannose-6-phosphate isomerase, class I, partial [Spirochaetaceae bacterium]|nr:mannose-6-phosphate isomerase, class I [Spirochaetaceae bacterium]
MKNYIKLEPKVMQYDWGNKTFIPNLLKQRIDNNPKAELWMGTHSGAPSTVENGKLFSTFLEENPSFLGQQHLDKYGTFLPLLFKVLSIEKPLSIQCHPSIPIAKEGWKREEEYRKTHPRNLWNYKDDNRKAEVIYALTPITAMCGFASYGVVKNNLLTTIPVGYNDYFKTIDENNVLPEDEKLSAIFELLYRMDVADLNMLIIELMENIKVNKISDVFLTK